jgi:hypothetical protein
VGLHSHQGFDRPWLRQSEFCAESGKLRPMMLAHRGWALRVSLVTWYIAGVLGWLMMAMVKGAAERSAWSDPLLIVFSLISLTMIALALDGTILIVARGDTLLVIGVFRRVKLDRDACRFVVRRIGRLRSLSHTVLLTDGRRHRQICHYWMWGDFLADRAVARLERTLLEN